MSTMGKDEGHLLALANSSGYFFQIRVEQEIQKVLLGLNKGWSILTKEHPWNDPETGESGFIDLILVMGLGRIVIECKRTKDGKWVFLVPNATGPVDTALLVWTKPQATGWGEVRLAPESSESAFCVLQRKGKKEDLTLEGIARTLLLSMEEIANQESELFPLPWEPPGGTRVYVPVIMTNAALYTCCFDPREVDLRTGELRKAELVSVPFVRFRKTLTSRKVNGLTAFALEDLSRVNERTIFIVNTEHLARFLGELKFKGDESTDKFPWDRSEA